MGRRRARYVHQQWAAAAKIDVCAVELKPVCRHPIIAGVAAKGRARLETNHRFAAVPVAAGVKRVTGRNKWVFPVAGNPANAPYSTAPRTAMSRAGPRRYSRGIIYGHAHKPAVKHTAIRHAPIPNIKNVTHDAERWSLLLNRCIEGFAVICSRLRHVHWPAGVDVACIYVKGNDEMFYGLTVIGCGYCV